MTKYKPLMSIKKMIRVSVINRISLIALLAILFSGCNGNQPLNPVDDADFNGEVSAIGSMIDLKFQDADSDLIKLVRRATARYNSTTQAVHAGYENNGHCVEHPDLGGMGYHWVNGELTDPVFDPANPEALLYEPDKNGNLKLVGVEYIVIDIGQDHPHFGDYPFDIGGTPVPVDHYSLHVWLYKDNPNGMFTPFNPNVTCN